MRAVRNLLNQLTGEELDTPLLIFIDEVIDSEDDDNMQL